MPLYESRLDKLGPPDLEAKRILIADLLRGLFSIKEAKIDHRDLKGDNVFINIMDGKHRAYIADFGCARREMQPASQNNGDKYDCLLGNFFYRPPEKRIAKKMSSEIVSQYQKKKFAIAKAYKDLTDEDSIRKKEQELAEVLNHENEALKKSRQLIDDTWLHHDTWGIGLLCLGILALGKNIDPARFTIDYYAFLFEDKIADCIYSPSNVKSLDLNAIYTDIQHRVDDLLHEFEDHLSDPLEHEMLGIVKQLLQADPAKRITAKDAVALAVVHV